MEVDTDAALSDPHITSSSQTPPPEGIYKTATHLRILVEHWRFMELFLSQWSITTSKLSLNSLLSLGKELVEGYLARLVIATQATVDIGEGFPRQIWEIKRDRSAQPQFYKPRHVL